MSISLLSHHFFFFFFNDTATTEIYTLSLHDALPISESDRTAYTAAYARPGRTRAGWPYFVSFSRPPKDFRELSQPSRSEEHTSELQSRQYLVCRLLLAKKKNTKMTAYARACSPEHQG